MKQRKLQVNSSSYRFQEVDQRIRTGEKYVDYLFKVVEQYVGSAKVFTGISAALLGLPFLQLKTLLLMARINGMVWLLGAAAACLGVSIVVGAFYQLHSVQIVEDEVESDGQNYERYLRFLVLEYRVMVAATGLGILTMFSCLALFVCKGDSATLCE